MSVLNALTGLMAAVEVSVKKDIAAEVKSICDDGFELFSNEMLLLGEKALDLSKAKSGGDALESYKHTFNALLDAMDGVDSLRQYRKDCFDKYSSITGHVLETVLAHKADPTRKIVRARIGDSYIVSERQVLADHRNAASQRYLDGKNEYSKAKQAIAMLSDKEQSKYFKALEDALVELLNLKELRDTAQLEVDKLFQLTQELEQQFGYSFDDNGKKVYPDNGYNQQVRALTKAGRTAYTQLLKVKDMFMIEQHLPDYHKIMAEAAHMFKMPVK